MIIVNRPPLHPQLSQFWAWKSCEVLYCLLHPTLYGKSKEQQKLFWFGWGQIVVGVISVPGENIVLKMFCHFEGYSVLIRHVTLYFRQVAPRRSVPLKCPNLKFPGQFKSERVWRKEESSVNTPTVAKIRLQHRTAVEICYWTISVLC